MVIPWRNRARRAMQTRLREGLRANGDARPHYIVVGQELIAYHLVNLLGPVGHLQPQLGWGWRHFVFHEARRRGLSVHHIDGEYPCPPDQRLEDEAEQVHRLRQLSQNILGLIEASPQP